LTVLAGLLVVLFFLPKITTEPLLYGKTVTPSPVAKTDLAQLNWPKDQQINPKILMYHHIGALPSDADDIRKGLTVSADNFEAGLKTLRDGNYTVVTLQKMYEMVAQGEDVSKIVVLTFDDGYDDNYVHGLPALQKYGFTGTFFIISDKIGQAEYLSEGQIKELLLAGNEIGSHSVSHPDLATAPLTKVASEVEKSKSDLESLFGQKIVSFCYPAGRFSTDVEREIESAGYKIAVTTQKGQAFSTNNPFEIPRYRINPTTDLSSIIK